MKLAIAVLGVLMMGTACYVYVNWAVRRPPFERRGRDATVAKTLPVFTTREADNKTAASQASTQRQLRKAFEAHERSEGDCLGKDCYGIDGSFVRAERWKNFQKEANGLMPLATATHVSVTKTTDGGDWVITLSDSVGQNEESNPVSGHHQVSLWVNGSGENKELEVRDISPY